MTQFDREHGKGSRPWVANFPLLIILAVVVLLGVWFISERSWNFYNADAEPRAVTPRGDLAADEQSTISLFQNASPSVVFITTIALKSDFFRLNIFEIPQGTGSGFVWDKDGHIVTNFHVIEGALRTGGKVRVRFVDQSEWDASVVGYDRSSDLAVLFVNAPSSKLKPIPVGTSEDLRVGQKVFAIGNPFGFDHSLTTGVVSALDREVVTKAGAKVSGLVQTDAAINPGNSGGPVLDSASRLIGVSTAIVSNYGYSSGVGFAIPVDTVNVMVPQILRHGSSGRAGLGVKIFDDKIARTFGFREGALIAEVNKGSAAEAAGLRTARYVLKKGRYEVDGDLVVSIDNETVTSREELIEALGACKVGDEVELVVVRGGNRYKAGVKLQALD